MDAIGQTIGIHPPLHQLLPNDPPPALAPHHPHIACRGVHESGDRIDIDLGVSGHDHHCGSVVDGV